MNATLRKQFDEAIAAQEMEERAEDEARTRRMRVMANAPFSLRVHDTVRALSRGEPEIGLRVIHGGIVLKAAKETIALKEARKAQEASV